MERVKWLENIINEEVIEYIGEKRKLLNNTQRRKAKWIDHILWRICLLYDAIKGEMKEVKGVSKKKKNTAP